MTDIELNCVIGNPVLSIIIQLAPEFDVMKILLSSESANNLFTYTAKEMMALFSIPLCAVIQF